MNVLILTASTGGGHNRASNALKSYINSYDPETNVSIIDAIEECSSVLNYAVVNGYKALVTLTPGLFGAMYKSSDKKSPLSDTVNVVYQQCAKRMQSKIEELQPDVIISCHPFAGAIIGYMKEKYEYDMPLITIVTDFLPHRAYIAQGIDAYVTASSQAKEILAAQYNIDRSRIYDYGHPVFDRFYEGNGRKREDVLAELEFDPEKRTVLIMAGSFGVTDILEIYENLLTIDVDYQIIVITGRNKKLYDAFDELLNNAAEEIVTEEEPEFLKGVGEDNVLRFMYNQSEIVKEKLTKTFRHTIANHKPTRLFFFIDNVDDYMHASDLIVTKPGGLTTSESIACALPMVVFKAYPGQEEQNAALLVENNIGVILEKSSEAAETVGALLKSDTRLREMRESCRRFVHKNSCEHIYELAKELAEKDKNSAE
ncbi:MAG: galactosyldiacylglycerol synthase [Ruminococcus sp.]|uniref:MGDG synthase family glycosyltransferase n=1 Tax=Ruminococcus sp. TaxID=41978 RepID=UPI00287394D6|nr:glycosyltransferase [Ruminococcus sp.]MBQ3285311.1 galactosyldiacylglycerol synthase [Ruminococcus sp.]